jgi:4-amino-4-deoxy-L-arabinose transferase-like glycosyltransferase
MSNPTPISFGKPFSRPSPRVTRQGVQVAAAALLPLTAFAIFLFYGFLMLPMLGFEADEVMFAYDFGHPRAALAWFAYFPGREAPYMLMSYLGALKSWLYAPLLALFDPTVWSIRTPVLLASALTILLAAWLLRQIGGWTAAAIVICLLATDLVFQITAVFDWGPVVLQNLLLVVGLILIVKWRQNMRTSLLFWAGFVFGLSLWNKALFLWNLSGMAVALLIIAFPELIRLWRPKRMIAFIIGLCAGAAPLIVFNIEFSGITLSANAHSSLAEVGKKASYLRRSLDGEIGPTTLVSSRNPGLDRIHRPFESAALSLADHETGSPSNWRFFCGFAIVGLSLLAAPGARRRWILFFLISGAIGWFESALTLNAGNTIHHAVLFWIDWYCAVALGAAGLATVRPRITAPVIGLLIVVLTLRGAFLENLAYANMILFSPRTAWTNADLPLNRFLSQSGVNRAIVADWGIASIVGLHSKGAIALKDEEFELNLGVFDRDAFSACLHPSCVVITHKPNQTLFPVAAQTLDNSLRQAGLTRTNLATIADTHGFPVFSIFSLGTEAVAAASPAQKIGRSGAVSTGTVIAVKYPRSAEFRFWATPVAGPAGQNGLVQTIHWSVPGVTQIEVHVNSPSGTLFTTGADTGEAETGPWATRGLRFYLQDSRSGNAASANRTVAELVLK